MTSQPTGRNKRRADRVRITSSRQIWNLSEGGAFLASTSPRRLGSLVQFEFRLGDRGPVFKALAKVIRVLYKPNPKSGEPAGMAIQFVKMTPEDLDHLRRYLFSIQEENEPPEDVPPAF